MNMPEFFLKRWEAEQAAFEKVLRAIPGDKLDYRPHERSNSSGGIAWQLAEEQRSLGEVVDRGVVQWATREQPKSIDDIVAAWDRATEALRGKLKDVDEAKWNGEAKMMMGENAVWTDTLGGMLWGFLLDMIHHRGQLSAYLRPMGARVPAIYGPSADDSGE